MINLEWALRYWLGCVCHCDLTYHFLYRYWPTGWALPLFRHAGRNVANIGSEGLYGVLRVWCGIGLKACWLDQTVCSRLGLCLFDQRNICLGLFKELGEFWLIHVTWNEPWLKNRMENFHSRIRPLDWAMLVFRQTETLQKFVSEHAAIPNHRWSWRRTTTGLGAA